MTIPPALAFPRALANLYEDPEWSQKDLAGPIESLKTQVAKSKLGVLAPRQLLRYQQELAERARLGHPACFTRCGQGQGRVGWPKPGNSVEIGSSFGQ